MLGALPMRHTTQTRTLRPNSGILPLRPNGRERVGQKMASTVKAKKASAKKTSKKAAPVKKATPKPKKKGLLARLFSR